MVQHESTLKQRKYSSGNFTTKLSLEASLANPVLILENMPFLSILHSLVDLALYHFTKLPPVYAIFSSALFAV